MRPEVFDRGRAKAMEYMTITLDALSPWKKIRGADGMDTQDWNPEGNTIALVGGQSQQSPQPTTRYEVVGGVSRPVIDGGVQIPLTSKVPQIGWEYVVRKVAGRADTALLGRRYHVVSVPIESHATARRLDVVDVTDAYQED